MSRQSEPEPQLRQPRYWPAWLGIGFLWVSAQCPHPVRMGLGRILGWSMYLLGRDRRHITEVNLRLCFPELEDSAQRQLVRKTFVSNAMGLVETAFAWFRDPELLRPRAQIEGLEHLQAALERGKGVILLGGHFTTLDLGGALLSLFQDIDVTYRPHPNPVFHHYMLRGRQRLYGTAFDRNEVRGMLRSLKKNRVVWYAPDQDYGAKHSVFAPFFGIPAASITATGRFAEMSGATVVPFSHYRTPDNRGYHLLIEPPLADFPAADPVVNATRVNEWLESAIRRQPDQYMWLHRRFKTRPPGEPRPYHRKLVKTISERRLLAMYEIGEVIGGQREEPKVLAAPDGDFIKFFRQRKLISTSRFRPQALQFVKNSIALREYGIKAPMCDRMYRCRKLGVDVIRYQGVIGEEVRDLVSAGDLSILDRLPAYLETLHSKGIMFRAIHLANILVTPENEFALIDISDLDIKSGPMNTWRRARNILHLLNKRDDREYFTAYGRERFVEGYLQAWGVSDYRASYLKNYVRRNAEF